MSATPDTKKPIIDETIDYPEYVTATARVEGEWIKPFYLMLNDSLTEDGDATEDVADFMIRTEWPQFVHLYKRKVKQVGRTPEQDIVIWQREEAGAAQG